MRTTKFEIKENYWENDDIHAAFIHNSLSDELENIECIVAEVCGENDGYDWYWILRMKNGEFAWATGGCDYTGWACRSNAVIAKYFYTAEIAIKELVVDEYEPRKNIKECLLKQINEELPFAIYTESHDQNKEKG